MLFNSKKFEDVIQNYQSFNYSALKSLKEEIENLIYFINHTFNYKAWAFIKKIWYIPPVAYIFCLLGFFISNLDYQ